MFEAPYSTATIKIPNVLVPGNEESDNPLEFDIAPAWGPDIARLRSVMEASSVVGGDWDPATQDTVVKAFQTSGGAFVNAVTAVRGLVVPFQMALRAGLVAAMQPSAKPDQKIPVTTGADFSRISSDPNMLGISLFVAYEVMKLTKANNVDSRFFMQPSGSSGVGTGRRTRTIAGSARRTSKGPGTAAGK